MDGQAQHAGYVVTQKRNSGEACVTQRCLVLWGRESTHWSSQTDVSQLRWDPWWRMRGKLLSFGVQGQPDSIWVKLSHLRINNNGRLGFRYGQLPAVKCRRQTGSLLVWPLSPKLSGNGFNSFGNRWTHFTAGVWALDLKESFKPITHGGHSAISPSLLPIPQVLRNG